MSDCPRFGKLVNGCRFEPRYDTASSGTGNVNVNGEIKSNDAELVRAFFHGFGPHKTYVHDVCVRCGKIAKREKSA